MKNLFFIILTVALLTTGLDSVGHASTVASSCSHHVTVDVNMDEDCSDEQSQNQTQSDECQDCCCVHSHVLNATFTNVTTDMVSDSIIFEAQTSLILNNLPPLYRPPIA